MIVVAGPSGVGKSTLITQIARGEHPELSRTLGFDSGTIWEKRSASQLERSAAITKSFDNLIFHYDIMRPVLRRYRDGYIADPALKSLDQAARLSIVSLWAPDDALITRLSTRTSLPFRRSLTPLNFPVRIARKRRYARLRRLYRRPQAVSQQYASWFDFTQDRQPTCEQHLVVDVSNNVIRFTTISEWLAAPHHDRAQSPDGSCGCGGGGGGGCSHGRAAQ
ncbi:MAG: hypothetical protein D8M59_02165 [Planctomycetes bacterium]|nr:hypothetical protein [Planctomycetota bacterium]